MVSIQDVIKDNLKDKKSWPIRPGDIIRVEQQYTDKKGKIHSSIFEGVVLKISSGHGLSKTFTVRRVVDGVGVERIYPLYSPTIKKIEILRRQKIRRAKLYYLRKLSGKKARLARKEIDKKTADLLLSKQEEVLEEPKKEAESSEGSSKIPKRSKESTLKIEERDKSKKE